MSLTLPRRLGCVRPLVVLGRSSSCQQGVEQQHLAARRVLQVRRIVAGSSVWRGWATITLSLPADGTLEMQIEHRQLFVGVDAKQQHHVMDRVRPVLRLHDLGHGRQPGIDGAHVAAIAMVDVIGAHKLAHKALQQVVAFVGQLGAADAANGVCAVLALDALQLLGDQTEGFLPRGGLQLAVAATSGMVSRFSWFTQP